LKYFGEAYEGRVGMLRLVSNEKKSSVVRMLLTMKRAAKGS
jgi:hypothetical protein